LRVLEDDVRSYAQRVAPTETLDVIKADPPDNRILECATTAKSDFIVSGDVRHMLPLGEYQGIPIVKVAAFMETLQGQA
jgi:predicted nucleic acid-binding protein